MFKKSNRTNNSSLPNLSLSYRDVDKPQFGLITDTNEEIELESLGQIPNIMKAQSSRLLEKDCYLIVNDSFTPEAIRAIIGCFLLQMIPGC